MEETIDEVARGPCTRRTTRSKPQTIPLLSLETSPRKTKQMNGKKFKAELPQPMSKTETTEPTKSNDQNDENQLSTSLLSTSSSSSTSSETTTLIDPVTGLLIPMQESEEGQYVPIDDRDNNRCVNIFGTFHFKFSYISIGFFFVFFLHEKYFFNVYVCSTYLFKNLNCLFD